MAVLPELQNQGIGSLLVREGLSECERIGCGLVVVLGHAKYYPRFGFVPAIRRLAFSVSVLLMFLCAERARVLSEQAWLVPALICRSNSS